MDIQLSLHRQRIVGRIQLQAAIIGSAANTKFYRLEGQTSFIEFEIQYQVIECHLREKHLISTDFDIGIADFKHLQVKRLI